MRPTRLLLALPFLLAAVPATAQPSIAEAAYHLCQKATFAPELAPKQEALCECAAEAWAAKPPGFASFLVAYVDEFRRQGGNTDRVDQVMAQMFGISVADANTQAALIRGELEAAALACLN